jgi:hypothetical protein
LAFVRVGIKAPFTIEYWMAIEDQAFLKSYELTPPEPPSPLLQSTSCLSFSVFLCVSGRACWRERGEGDRAGAKSYLGEKAWFFINHFILSALHLFTTVGQDTEQKLFSSASTYSTVCSRILLCGKIIDFLGMRNWVYTS